jgi:hypothetical protein
MGRSRTTALNPIKKIVIIMTMMAMNCISTQPHQPLRGLRRAAAHHIEKAQQQHDSNGGHRHRHHHRT